MNKFNLLLLTCLLLAQPAKADVTANLATVAGTDSPLSVPFVDFEPSWRGWESLGLSPRLIGQESTVREEFVKRFMN